MRTPPSLLAASLLCLVACATARPAASGPAGSGPYLSKATMPRLLEVLPPAPTAGTPRYELDRRVFLATRALQGTPRWALATHDVDGAVPGMLEDFACALDLKVDAAQAPRLSALLARVDADASQITKPAKKGFARQRPFQIDAGPVCQPLEQLHSFDYPSGHASWGWSVGLVLSQLVPGRATEILVRARAYAESRVVCGAHNLSAIEAGETSATTLLAGLNASPEFRADVAAARAELEALRQSAPRPDAQRCAEERALISAPLW